MNLTPEQRSAALDIVKSIREDPEYATRPELHAKVDQIEQQLGRYDVAPTGERAAKLQRDIAASQSPLPGGQWAQPIERGLRYAGVIGGEGNESVPQSILHQANAGAASLLSNVPGLMQGAEALGELSDTLVPGQDPRHNILPRPGGTRQLIATAPSPLVAEAQGVLPYASPSATSRALIRPVTELAGKGSQAAYGVAPGASSAAGAAAESLAGPVKALAQNTIMRGVARRLPGTILPSVATQVGLNTALNTAATAGKAVGGQDYSIMEDVVKPSLAPESLLPAAALGAIPAPMGRARTRAGQEAETYATVRRRGGGQIPAELDQTRGEQGISDIKDQAARGVEAARAEGDRQLEGFQQQATERKRTFSDNAARAITAAKDAWRARQEKLAASNQADVAVAKRSADEAIAKAGAEQEEPARQLYTNEREAWMGKGGKGGMYRAKLDEIQAAGDRGESATIADDLRQVAQKYQPTSEPVGEEPGPAEPSPLSRTLSLGKGVNALVESVIGHLGENPSMREYQNALREVDVAAERHKGEPSARQAFTEVAAKLRSDAYRQFPKFQELAGQHREQMGRLETMDQALYGKDDPRIGEGSSQANRFAGDTAEGEPVKVPMASTTKAARWLSGEGEDPTTAHTYEAYRRLGRPYQRILDTIQAIKDQARGHVADVETDAAARAADLESRSTRSERNISAVQKQRERAMTDELAGQKSQLEQQRQEGIDAAQAAGDQLVNEKVAVERSRFPSISKLAPAAALIAGAQAYHGRHSLPMTVAGAVHGAKLLAPWARSRAAYYTPEALRADPELVRSNMLPALSGPLAFEGSDPFSALASLGTSERSAPVNAALRRREEEKAKAIEEMVQRLIQAGQDGKEARRVAEAAYE